MAIMEPNFSNIANCEAAPTPLQPYTFKLQCSFVAPATIN